MVKMRKVGCVAACNRTPPQRQQFRDVSNVATIQRCKSFEELPSGSPPYANYGDSVRKKSERRKLPGRSCDYCSNFYKGLREQGEDVTSLMNVASRHRHKHVRPATPPGFWNPIFSDDEESLPSRMKTLPGFLQWSMNDKREWTAGGVDNLDDSF